MSPTKGKESHFSTYWVAIVTTTCVKIFRCCYITFSPVLHVFSHQLCSHHCGVDPIHHRTQEGWKVREDSADSPAQSVSHLRQRAHWDSKVCDCHLSRMLCRPPRPWEFLEEETKKGVPSSFIPSRASFGKAQRCWRKTITHQFILWSLLSARGSVGMRDEECGVLL